MAREESEKSSLRFRSVESIPTTWWMDSRNRNEFQRKIQRIRDDASRRKLSQDRWCHLRFCLVQHGESSRDHCPHIPRNRIAVSESSASLSTFPMRRLFCKPIIIFAPPSTPIFASRAMNYSSNRSATDTSCLRRPLSHDSSTLEMLRVRYNLIQLGVGIFEREDKNFKFS